MTSEPTLLEWVERSCVAVALGCAAFVTLAAAQSHFYSSLPVPAPPAHGGQLPGEGGNSAAPSAGARASAPVRPGDWVGRLEAPSVGLSATIIEGSGDEMLARAAGHIEDTAFPGTAGNVGIAGHRDTTFRAVRKLAVGDTLLLTTASGRFAYRIKRAFVVKPDAVSVLDPTPTPSLTLVTCYPFTFIGHAPMRYIVQAELQQDTGAGGSEVVF